jgi:hypothetical protein
LFSLLFLIPFLARGANVYIWNYDPLGRFYDAEVGDSVDCAYGLEQALSANGHTFTTGTTLPTTFSGYAAGLSPLVGFVVEGMFLLLLRRILLLC